MNIPLGTIALATAVVAALVSLWICSVEKLKGLNWIWRVVLVAAAAVLLHVASVFLEDWRSETFGERIQGLWLEIFNEFPNESQKYSIAFIEYNKRYDCLNSGGHGYAATGECVSVWTSDVFVPHSRKNQCLLTYTGDIFDTAHDITGQGLMRFDPPGWVKGRGAFQNGSGSFHEAYAKHEKVSYKLRRITPHLCQEVLGKDSLEEEDYGKFIRCYHDKYGENGKRVIGKNQPEVPSL